MGELLNFVAPFFTTPTNYAEMLKKLAGFAFYHVLFITFWLSKIPQVDSFLRWLDSLVPYASTFHASAFLIALLGALISNILPIHDRISDVFQIRRRFDTNHIMLPLAKLTGTKITEKKIRAFVKDRHRVMRDIFYKFASSRDPNALVDKHDIEHALSQWAWFWSFIEGTVFWMVGALIAFAFGAESIAGPMLTIASGLLLAALLFSYRLPRYARPQIEAIAANVAASEHVKAVLDAL